MSAIYEVCCMHFEVELEVAYELSSTLHCVTLHYITLHYITLHYKISTLIGMKYLVCKLCNMVDQCPVLLPVFARPIIAHKLLNFRTSANTTEIMSVIMSRVKKMCTSCLGKLHIKDSLYLLY